MANIVLRDNDDAFTTTFGTLGIPDIFGLVSTSPIDPHFPVITVST